MSPLYGGAREERAAPGTDDELEQVVVRVAVPVVDAEGVEEVVVTRERHPGSGGSEAAPEDVAIDRVRPEAVGVEGLEGGLVTEDEDVGRGVGGELRVEPGLVHAMEVHVLVEADEEGVLRR